VETLKFKLACSDVSAGVKQLPEATELLNSIQEGPLQIPTGTPIIMIEVYFFWVLSERIRESIL